MKAKIAVLVFVSLSCVFTLPESAALAQGPAPEDAWDHFHKGQRFFDIGKWDQAVEEFEKAYTLRSEPSFLYNMAETFRRKGDTKRALDVYTNFLIKAPKSSLRPEVEGWIRKLQLQVDEVASAPKATAPTTSAERTVVAPAPAVVFDRPSQPFTPGPTVRADLPAQVPQQPGSAQVGPRVAPGSAPWPTLSTYGGQAVSPVPPQQQPWQAPASPPTLSTSGANPVRTEPLRLPMPPTPAPQALYLAPTWPPVAAPPVPQPNSGASVPEPYVSGSSSRSLLPQPIPEAYPRTVGGPPGMGLNAGPATPTVPAAGPAQVSSLSASASPAQPGQQLRTAGIICGAVGLASVGAGVIFGLEASAYSNSVENSTLFNASYEDRGKLYEKLQWGAYGIGAALAATGALLYAIGFNSGPSPTVVMVPAVLPGAAGVSARGVF